MISRFLNITANKELCTELGCSLFQWNFEVHTLCSLRALSALLVHSYWTHLLKSCAHTVLWSRSKIMDINFALFSGPFLVAKYKALNIYENSHVIAEKSRDERHAHLYK